MHHQLTDGQPGCGRPVKGISPCLPPRLSPLGKRFPGSLPLQKAWQCSCMAPVFCHPAPSEQNKALMFMEGALALSSFLSWYGSQACFLSAKAMTKWPWQASSRSVSLCRELGQNITLTWGQRPSLMGSTCSRGECISSAALGRPGDRLSSQLLLWNVPCWVSVLSSQSGRNPGKCGSRFTPAAFWLFVSSPGVMGIHGRIPGAQPVPIPIREKGLHVERKLSYVCWSGTARKEKGARLCSTHR